MRIRQTSQAEKFDNLHKSIISVNLALQRAEALHKLTLESFEDLKSNSTEVWRCLMKDEKRLDRLETEIDRVDIAVTEKMKMIQE